MITPRYKIMVDNKLAIVEYGLLRASIGPDAIESKMPYISTFPAKLWSMHLQKAIDIIKVKIYEHKKETINSLKYSTHLKKQ